MINITQNEDAAVPLLVPKTFKWFHCFAEKAIQRFTYRKRGGVSHHLQNPFRLAYRYLGQRPLSGYHLAMVSLALFLAVATIWSRQNMQTTALVTTETATAEAKAQFVNYTSSYTEDFTTNPEASEAIQLASSINDSSGYYTQPILTETKITEVAPTEPEVRTESVKYTIQPGDTLSGIGEKYALKVYTIMYENKLKTESIQPGDVLVLPVDDYSDSLLAQYKKSLTAVAVAASSTSNTTQKSTSSSSYTGTTSTGWIQPVSYSYISRRLGSGHTGIDFVTPTGSSVVASKSGTVITVSTGWSGGYGNMILIDHGNGIKSRYAHLSSIAVSVGETVSAGQYIGASGNTGRSTGPHLHFEAIVNGTYTAPF